MKMRFDYYMIGVKYLIKKRRSDPKLISYNCHSPKFESRNQRLDQQTMQ